MNARHSIPSQAPLQHQLLLAIRDAIALVLIVWPLLGSFYPLESYLSLGQGEGLTGYASLPIPVTTLLLVVSSLAAIAFGYAAARRGRLRHQPLLYLLLALGLASVLWSADAQFSFQRVLRLFPPIVLGIVLPQFYGQARFRRMMTIGFLVSAIASILVSVADPALGLARLGNGYEDAWRGAFVHKNLTGAIFAAGLFAAGLAWRTRAVGRILGAATVLLCLVMLMKAHSGTSIGAFVVGAGVAVMLILVQGLPPRLRVISVFFVVVMALLAILAVIFGLPEIIGATGRDMTLTGRTQIWAVVWDRIKLRPLTGYGYAFWGTGNPIIPEMWQEIGDQVPHAHDSWLGLWIDMGVAAPALVLAAILGIYRRALKLVLLTNDPSAPFIGGMMTFWLVRSVTETEFTEPFITAIFFLAWIGTDLGQSLRRIRRPGPAAAVPAPRHGDRLYPVAGMATVRR